MTHFRGLPNAAYTAWHPLCDLRGAGETTTLLHAVDCPTCRRILKLDGREWAAAKPDPRMVPASRDFLDRKRQAGGDR